MNVAISNGQELQEHAYVYVHVSISICQQHAGVHYKYRYMYRRTYRCQQATANSTLSKHMRIGKGSYTCVRAGVCMCVRVCITWGGESSNSHRDF